MPEIPEIGVRRISVPEILEWRSIPPQSIPDAPPITLHLGFPVADIPGCVETRNSAAGNEQIYTDDPRGNLIVCGAEMPSYRPLDFTPGTLNYSRAKPPAIDPDTKKPAKESTQPGNVSPLPSGGLDIPKVTPELPCPAPDAIPLGAKNKSQTVRRCSAQSCQTNRQEDDQKDQGEAGEEGGCRVCLAAPEVSALSA